MPVSQYHTKHGLQKLEGELERKEEGEREGGLERKEGDSFGQAVIDVINGDQEL